MITFRTVRWKNFISTGAAFTEIDFTKSTNTLIIGSNGAGKSTVLDALCFGLFGKPFRNINKPNLLNSINGKEGVVEIEFDIGQKKYKIIRGIKPNKFEIYCNGTLLNQDAAAKDYQKVLEENILKLNYKSFTQVVILGSASFVPFMQMKASDRREIIEDLLDIQIFSTMNGVLKEKMSFLKENMSKGKYAIDLIEEKIAMQISNIEEHKKHNDIEISKKKEEVETSKLQLKNILKQVGLINKHIDVLTAKIGDKQVKLEKKSKSLFQLQGKVENNIKKNEKDIEGAWSEDWWFDCLGYVISDVAQTDAINGFWESKEYEFRVVSRDNFISFYLKNLTDDIIIHNSIGLNKGGQPRILFNSTTGMITLMFIYYFILFFF